MSQGLGKPDAMPWVTPCMTVRDVSKAIDFYERAFGFGSRNCFPGPDGAIMHAEVTCNDGVIMLSPEGAFGTMCKTPATSGLPGSISLYVYSDDVDALCARAAEAGAEVVSPPSDMFWGDRMCRLTDPDGYAWSFATRVKEVTPAEMDAAVADACAEAPAVA